MTLFETFFASDKFLHFSVTAAIFLFDAGLRYFTKINERPLLAMSYGMRDVLLLGLLKEFADYLGMGNPELLDLVANILGLIFPIYIYVAWRYRQDYFKNPFLSKLLKVRAAFFDSSRDFLKEFREAIRLEEKYLSTRIIDLISPQFASDKELLTLHKELKKEWKQEKILRQKSLALLGKLIILILLACFEFIIDLIRMPFWILIQSLSLILKGIKAIQ